MVGPSVPFPARGGCFGVGRSEAFQTLSLPYKILKICGKTFNSIRKTLKHCSHKDRKTFTIFYELRSRPRRRVVVVCLCGFV